MSLVRAALGPALRGWDLAPLPFPPRLEEPARGWRIHKCESWSFPPGPFPKGCSRGRGVQEEGAGLWRSGTLAWVPGDSIGDPGLMPVSSWASASSGHEGRQPTEVLALGKHWVPGPPDALPAGVPPPPLQDTSFCGAVDQRPGSVSQACS